VDGGPYLTSVATLTPTARVDSRAAHVYDEGMDSTNIAEILKDFLTVAEAAKRLGKTERLVQSLCKRGALPGAIQLGRDWRIPPAAVAARKKMAAKNRLPKGGRGVTAYSDGTSVAAKNSEKSAAKRQ
jgi:excisionase family DNA binding protein